MKFGSFNEWCPTVLLSLTPSPPKRLGCALALYVKEEMILLYHVFAGYLECQADRIHVC